MSSQSERISLAEHEVRWAEGSKSTTDALPSAPIVQTSAQFVSGFIPPDFIWDGILQRGFIYSLTAATGVGKTAIALLASAKLAQGHKLAQRETLPGRVIILAGENPDDLRMRWLAMAEHLAFDVKTIDVHFVEGTFSLEGFTNQVVSQIHDLGGCNLIVIDTSAAFFEGSDENSNSEMGIHARKLRAFTRAEGRPSVLVLAHPTKTANAENLLPRGGGAFLAEIDGNLTAKKEGEIIEVHWAGKLRGPGFEPIPFELKSVTAAALVDCRGRNLTTVIARALTDEEAGQRAAKTFAQEDQLLLAMDQSPPPSISALATSLGLAKSTTHRLIKNLEQDGMAAKGRHATWELTEAGKKIALKLTKEGFSLVER